MSYQLHLNLQQTATFNIAISFWKKKEVKDQAAEFFQSHVDVPAYNIQIEWGKFTKSLVDKWKNDVLPIKLDVELIYIIQMIGKTIFNWFQYFQHEFKTKEEAINCIDKIEWTSYGTVDIVKTFESFWLNNSNLDIIKVYAFACHHAIEDHIDNLWSKIPKDIQNIISNDIYCTSYNHILGYWQHRRDNNLPDLMGYLQNAVNDFNSEEKRVFDNIYDFNLSTEINMLRLSVYQADLNATKYFWEKLTDEERDKSVLKCTGIAVTSYYYNYIYKAREYMRIQYVEICIFLMNQMSEDHKKTLFNQKKRLDDWYNLGVDVKDSILEMILSTWPWQELFIPVLKDTIQYRNDDSEMDCTFLNVITNKMLENYELGYSIETDKYGYLLREAWIIIPAFIKQKMTQINIISTSINNLIRISDLDSLNLIFNDPAIANDRDKLIEIGSFAYRDLIEDDEFEKLDQFIEKILRSEEEKKEFKKKINIFRDLIYEGKFQLADKLLDWQNTTPEEKQTLKNNINPVALCTNFIRGDKYELLNKFLDWKFNTEEEKINFKDHFENNTVTIELICEIWERYGRDINLAKKKCSRFLHWLIESEEEITLFKKEIVVNFKSYESNMIDFANLKRGGVLIDFISWCLLDDENIKLAQSMIQAVVQSNIRPI